jgi:RNA polymerase sigma-70 factor (ECF subfamily)
VSATTPTSAPDDPRADHELVAAVALGDTRAFAALYQRHKVFVTRVARRFSSSDDDALDALQQTFTTFLAQFPAFRLDERAKLSTYLYPVVKNICLARARAQRVHHRDTSTLPPDDAAAMADTRALSRRPDDDTTRALADALSRLPEAQRETLLMRCVDEMTPDETAAALGVPVGTIKSRLHYALAALRADPVLGSLFE